MTNLTSRQSAKAGPARPPVSSSTDDRTGERGSASGNTAVLAVIAALALVTGLAFFASFHNFYTNDSYSYMTAAENLASGLGFTNAAGYPETIRTPGYPLLLVPFIWMHLDLKALMLFQHLLRLAVAVATAAVVFRLTRSRMQSIVAGVVVCLDLPMMESANQVMTELLYTIFLGIALWLLWESGKQARSWIWPVAAGLVAGGITMIRPIGLFFFVPAAAYLLLVRKSFRLRSVLSFLLAFSCLPFMWAARNQSRTGQFVFFPISSWNVLGYRAAGVLAINDPGDFYKNMEDRRTELVHEVCRQMSDVYGPPCIPLIEPQAAIPEKSIYYMRVGRQIVQQHPWAYVKLAVRGAGVMMLGDDAATFSQLTGINHEPAARILLIYTVPAFCLALAGAWSYWRSRRELFFLLFLTMIYYVGVTAGAEAYSRYRVPILPVYAMLIAAGVDFIVRRFRGMTAHTSGFDKPKGSGLL